MNFFVIGLIGSAGIIPSLASRSETADDKIHKCTSAWVSKGIESRVAFPVKSCIIDCKLSKGEEVAYDLIWPTLAFTSGVQNGECACFRAQDISSPDDMNSVLPVLSTGKPACLAEAEQQKDCWQRWIQARTNDYIKVQREGELSSNVIVNHHPDKYAVNLFGPYQCKSNGCPDGVCECDEDEQQVGDACVKLPTTLVEGFDDMELAAFRHYIRKVGKNGKDDDKADPQAKIIAQALIAEIDGGGENAANLLYQMYSGEDGLTVGKLKTEYDPNSGRLHGTGFNLNGMLTLAGLPLDNDDYKVSKEEFQRFLNPEC